MTLIVFLSFSSSYFAGSNLVSNWHWAPSSHAIVLPAPYELLEISSARAAKMILSKRFMGDQPKRKWHNGYEQTPTVLECRCAIGVVLTEWRRPYLCSLF